MAQKYGYAESSALRATNWGGHIYSVVDETNALENGMLVGLGGDVSVEVREAVTAAATDKVCLVLDVHVPYDQTTTMGQAEVYQFHRAGKATRAYDLFENDRFAIADYMATPLATACVKGNYLVNNGSRKYTEVAAASFDATEYGFAAIVQDIEYKNGLTLLRLRVVKNETVVELNSNL